MRTLPGVLVAVLAATAITMLIAFVVPSSNPYVLYFRYLCRHKLYACLYCCSLGVPWRGVTHDLSKFRPSEFKPFALWFYGRGHAADLREMFSAAWAWHYARNRHHWEHWVLTREGRSGVTARLLGTYAIAQGPPVGAERPDLASIKEMLADWLAAGPTKREPGSAFDNARTFYLAHRDEMILHPAAREFIDDELAIERTRESGWRDPVTILRQQCAASVALELNQRVVAPGGRHGFFVGYQRGKALVRLEATGALVHFHEKDLQRV
jgi:hypothetical protein